MINLAPGHKVGLSVPNPVLLAAGVMGYGDAGHRGLDTGQLGGVVVGPVTLRRRTGAGLSRMAETTGGYVLDTDLQNPGMMRMLRRYGRFWPRLGCPVLIQIADTHPGYAGEAVELLGRPAGDGYAVDVVAGLELLLPRQADAQITRELVAALCRYSDVPVWAKLPLEHAVELAPVAVAAGATGLVIGQAPRGALFNNPWPQAGEADPVTGSLGGPLAFAPMLAALLAVADLQLPCALIACGGIHTLSQAHHALAAGAMAFQIDSAAWIEPGLPARLVAELARSRPGRDAEHSGH